MILEFITLDKNYNNPIWLKPLNVQWNAKFYECGDFCIQIPTVSYEDIFAYVYCSERKQTGIIQKVFHESSIQGKMTQISGFFLERMFYDCVIRSTYKVTNKNICTIAKELIQTYCAQDNIIFGSYADLGTAIDFQETGGTLGEVLYTLLKTQNLTYQLEYDFKSGMITCNFVKGTDRTQDQTINNTVTFSETLKNLYGPQYTVDASNYKNYAIVAGEGEGSERIYVDVDMRQPGERMKQLLVDAGNVKKEELSLNEYKKQLSQRGLEKLMNHTNIENVEFSLDNSRITYLEDFNLGDKVNIVIEDFGLSYSAEIIEVREVLKDNQHTIEIELGDKIPTKFDRIMKG